MTRCMVKSFHIGFLLRIALVSALSQTMQSEDGLFAVDDECLQHKTEGDTACGLNAVQLRARPSATRTGDAPEQEQPIASASRPDSGNVSKAASSAPGCHGAWCETIFAFNELFDTNNPATMQTAFDKFTEWKSDSNGIKIAVTKHDYYEMYHGNVQKKLQEYIPQGFFEWDFKQLGHNYTVVSQEPNKVVVARDGSLTFNLGWWRRNMFWQYCVKALPQGSQFDYSTVDAFDDCIDCPAKLEYVLMKGGLSGKTNKWAITDLLVLKLK